MSILMYHKVHLETPTMWWVSVDNFYRQMLALQASKVVYLDDYDPTDSKQVVITFDGIYRNVLMYAAPILQKFGYPFELFLTSDYVGGDNAFDTCEPLADFTSSEELAQLVEMGGRLQWHTRSHADLTQLSPEAVDAELQIPEVLSGLDPKGFRWFAYPHGRYNEAVLEQVKPYFAGAVSCDQGHKSNPYALPRITVTDETKLFTSKISVIIASYNYGSYLAEAVESVLRQIRLPDEILISDDASTDHTPEIAEFYRRRYPDLIRTNRNETNLGIVSHFNKAIELVSGDYVVFLGADNRFRSDFIERTAAVLDGKEEVAIAYSDFALFGQRASIIFDQFPPERRGPIKLNSFYTIQFPDFDETSRRQLLEEGNFIHGSSMFRRQAFDQAGGYLDKENRPEDYDLFRRIVSQGWQAERVPHPILEYRQHSREQANIRMNTAAELHVYRQWTADLQASVAELEGQLLSIQAEREVLQNQVSTIEAERELLRSQVNTIEAERELLREDIKTIEAERELLRNQASTIEAEREVLHNKVSTIEAEREVLHSKVNTIEIERQLLSDQVSAAETERELLQDEVSTVTAECELLRDKVSTIQTEQELLYNKFTTVEAERELLRNKIATIEAERELLRGQISNIEADRELLRSQVSTIKAEHELLHHEIGTLRQIINSQKQHIAGLRSWLPIVAETISPPKKALHKLRQKWKKIRGQQPPPYRSNPAFQYPLFNVDYYRKQNPDVLSSELDPVFHYIHHGVAEGRNPNPFFDTVYYLREYPDVTETSLNPLEHYFMHGAAELRNPSPHFNTAYYLEQYPDVATSGLNPLVHFLLYGLREGRFASPS
ncbi:glycosyltransferase [Oscillatoria sp. CS-180]|uniref:glycosyltransferase n=1 Tax=Oscillatoria sp. CS-180 TaxID=3021720 RepID=UPI0023310928|nr:glycosyltransferase [Oscillatoria sp. CS-180]MDB9527020.1 glycosyltransferase [Oscillatoria sp. CS-180]